jgi:hypothetical protein
LMDLQHLEHSIISPFAKLNYYLVPSNSALKSNIFWDVMP